MSGAHLELLGLTHRYGDLAAVDDVHLEIAPGSLTTLVGPSGCGKSTLISLIAGLRTPDLGSIRIDGDDITHVLPEHRPVTVVFQKPLLLPHLDVRDNVAFALRMRGDGRRPARARAEEMLEQVDLPGAGRRSVQELSGGQEQRVALARALVCAPRVLLLDEPFSALDASLRESMRALVHELVRASRTTTLFVTHDRSEALLGDSVALMDRGAILGSGTPQAMYDHPPSAVGARLLGDVNAVAGTVASGQFTVIGTSTRIATDLPDGAATLVMRPERVRLGVSSPDAGFAASGTVLASRFAGDHLVSHVDVEGHPVTVHTTPEDAPRVGSLVQVWCPVAHCRVLDR